MGTTREAADADATAPPAGGDPAAALRGVRPAIDVLAMADVRARAARALFGTAAPARVGRFEVRGPIAGGGMGMVYAAHDTKLDRRVALKLVHPRLHGTPHARERLIAEARVLARLDHPNVVPVHDFVEIDDQIVIVMELIAGQTLAAWERACVRSWREIVAVYREAGRGLAAAHALGVVHRDFKPANVIVGDDGRVRVLDFGLARVYAELEAPEPGERPGEVLGTLAFMSPEQLAGDLATAASDQFSFCVAMHRALHGVAPFGGGDPVTLAAAICTGRVARGDRRIPRWLQRIVERGLAAAPAERHASMQALLANLDRDRATARRRVLIGGWFAIAVAVAVAITVRPAANDARSACDGGAAELGAVWSPPTRVRVIAMLESSRAPDAPELGRRILDGLDRYRDRWQAMHLDACSAHRRGAQSAELLDRRMACLRHRLGDFSAAVGVVAQTGPAALGNAIEVVARIPALAPCGDLDALQAGVAPPASPLVAEQVNALRRQLSHAGALEHAGRAQEARAEAQRTLAAATAVGYPPLVVEAALLDGKILLARRELPEAVASLAVAEQTALEHGLHAPAVVAAARRIYAEGSLGSDLPGLARQFAVVEPLSRGLHGDRFARPLLLNNIGVVHMAAGRRGEARRYFELARDALAGAAEPDLELVCIDQNLAMVTPEPVARAARARAAWERLRDALGPQHLATLQALYSYGHYVADPAVSLPLIREACAHYRRSHTELVHLRADCGAYEAFLMAELGDAGGATRRHEEVEALAASHAEHDVRAWGLLAAGYVRLHRGRALDARARFGTVLTELSTGVAWWIRQRAGHAHLGAGLAELALGHTAPAVHHLEQATAIFVEMAAISEDVENPQRLALARLALAAALRRQDVAAPRAAELARLGAEGRPGRPPPPWLP